MQDSQCARERRLGNLILLLTLVALIGGGIWVVGALLDLRRAQDCVGTGRRDCNIPLQAPVREH